MDRLSWIFDDPEQFRAFGTASTQSPFAFSTARPKSRSNSPCSSSSATATAETTLVIDRAVHALKLMETTAEGCIQLDSSESRLLKFARHPVINCIIRDMQIARFGSLQDFIEYVVRSVAVIVVRKLQRYFRWWAPAWRRPSCRARLSS
eukprot:11274206-Alexandrium_andersonii.AAC.1